MSLRKNAQDVAKPFFVKIMYSILSKSIPIFLGQFYNLKISVKSKQSPIGRKFAQSGHRGGGRGYVYRVSFAQ
jgi:hypothetical protein